MKNRTGRILALVMVLLLAFTLITGCGGDTTQTTGTTEGTSTTEESETFDPITIQFWNGWTGADGEVLVDLVDKFNSTNKWNITIEMDINSEFQEKFVSAAATQTGPDMIIGANNYKFLYTELLRDMNVVFDISELERSDISESILELCSLDDTLYVFPFQVTGRYLYWNKDLFEAAGLDPESPPVSYEQWAEYAEKITDESRNIYGSGISYSAIFTNLQILQRFGGLFIEDADDGGFSANFSGNEGYIDFFNWYRGMLDNGSNPLETDIGSMMRAGLIGITIDGAWLSAGLEDAGINYGVSILPYGDAGPMNPVSVSGFAVTTFASEEAALASYRFVEWWHTGNEGDSIEDTGVFTWSTIGFPTYFRPVMETEAYLSNEKLAAMTETNPDADSTYLAPSTFQNTFLLAMEIVQPLIESIAVENVDVNEALDRAQTAAEAVIASELGE